MRVREVVFFRRQRQLWEFFAQPLRAASREQFEHVRANPAARVDWEAIVALLLTAFLLTLQHYFLARRGYQALLYWMGLTGGSSWPVLRLVLPSDDPELIHATCWGVGQVLVYVALPLAVCKLVFRRSLSEYGVKLHGGFSYAWVYLVFYLGILPLILLASRSVSFQQTYPFYSPPGSRPDLYWSKLLYWEALYALQFLALEFFFRGFLLHSTRRQFGGYAILVMTVPYCMIHFGKPFPETLGAIGAGVILGFMSLKTRSIWLGAVVHIAVAWTMDIAAIWQREGTFPGLVSSI